MEDKEHINEKKQDNPEFIDSEVIIQKEIVEENKPRRTKKRSIFSKILNVLAGLLLLFVIIESAIGFIGFNDIKLDKEPKYVRNVTISYEGSNTITTYDFGLYKVVKSDNSKEYSTKLLPFFLD